MSRMYIVNHWSDAAAYSGEQIGDRLKDSSALHFNRDGSANVELYSEETAQAKKKTSIPLADRILPQAKRVRTLTEQLIELEQERKAGMDIHQYSQLRDILIIKRDRAEVLLKQAMQKKPVRNTDDKEEAQSDTRHANEAAQPEFMQEKREDSIKKACTSAIRDAIILITGSATLLIGFLVFF